MNADRLRVWGAFFVASTVWGSTWVAIKIGLETVPPLLSVTVRFLVAVILLGAIILWQRERIPWTRDARRVYLSMGILNFTLPFALVYWGQQFIPSALGSILFATFPFCVALASQLIAPGGRLDRYTMVGILLGFLGVLIIFWGDFRVSDSSALWGMAAIILSVMMQAVSLVQVKQWGKDVSPVAMNFVGMLMGMVALFVLTFFVEGARPVSWTLPAVFSVLYLAVIGSVLVLITYYWLLKRIDPVYLSLTSFINPIVALILGSVVLKETLRSSVLSGAALVLAGILVANWSSIGARLRRSRLP